MKFKENYKTGHTDNFVKLGYDLSFTAPTSYPNNENDYRIKDNIIITMNFINKNKDYFGYTANEEMLRETINDIMNRYGINKVEASIVLKKEFLSMEIEDEETI